MMDGGSSLSMNRLPPVSKSIPKGFKRHYGKISKRLALFSAGKVQSHSQSYCLSLSLSLFPRFSRPDYWEGTIVFEEIFSRM